MEVESIGVACVGIFVALFVVWILEAKMQHVTSIDLGIILASILGGAVAAYFAFGGSDLVYYPIGLVVGFFGYFILVPRLRKTP
jgi:hypothetical protein